MSFIGDFLKAMDGTFGIGRAGPVLPGSLALEPVVHQAFDLHVPFSKAAADGAAATATADTIFFTNPFDFNLVVAAGRITTLGAGVVADAANFATITVKTDNGAGGATAIALQAATTLADLGTLVSNVSKSFTTVTQANVVLVPGANLFFNIAKSGTGVVVPISNYTIRLHRGEY